MNHIETEHERDVKTRFLHGGALILPRHLGTFDAEERADHSLFQQFMKLFREHGAPGFLIPVAGELVQLPQLFIERHHAEERIDAALNDWSLRTNSKRQETKATCDETN